MSSSTHPDTCPVGHASDRKTERPAESYTPAIENLDGAWHIRSQHLVRQALREFGDESIQEGFSAELIRARTSSMRTPVLYMDGEPHRQVRAKIARYFAPVTVGRRYRDLMEARADELVAQARQRREFDLDQMSLRMAVHVTAQVIGLTNSDMEKMTRRLERFFAFPSVTPGKRAETRWAKFKVKLRSARSSLPLVFFHIHDVKPAIKARRAEPQEDVISHLIEEGYSDGEILAECLTYGAAGMVTTREFIVVAVWHLLERPDLMQRYLGAEEAERHQILHEILRVEPVVGHIYRTAVAPITLTDGDESWTIPEGALLDMYVRAANSDTAAVGEHPHSICPDRTRSRGVRPEVLSFGDGSHRCPGSHIAIQETDILLTRLLQLPLTIVQTPSLSWVDVVAGYELRNMRLRIG
ncbi:cytochrome P450 [Enemella sp. A6]|uniref:cytochrome P450 n=1 Tax=Enemella sp. A6 TaxID=3440152 RepID=UPI003EBFA213